MEENARKNGKDLGSERDEHDVAADDDKYAHENESDVSSDSSDSESGDNTADDGEDGVHHAMHLLRKVNHTVHNDEKQMENCQIQENLEETISDVLEVVLDRYWWPTVSQMFGDTSPTTRSEIHHQARMLAEGVRTTATARPSLLPWNDLVELRRLVLEGRWTLCARDIEGESRPPRCLNRNFEMLEFIIAQFGGANHREARGGRLQFTWQLRQGSSLC